jgi:hypothetical protein
VRIVGCTRGRVEFATSLRIRFDYGQVVQWVRQIEGGIRPLPVTGVDRDRS